MNEKFLSFLVVIFLATIFLCVPEGRTMSLTKNKKSDKDFETVQAAFSYFKDPSFNVIRYKNAGRFWKALKTFRKYYNRDLTLKKK